MASILFALLLWSRILDVIVISSVLHNLLEYILILYGDDILLFISESYTSLSVLMFLINAFGQIARYSVN